MPYSLQILACRAASCRAEIVLPFLAPLENFPLGASVGGDPYLHVACPNCSHVFRYTDALSHQRISDSYPYRRPANTVWVRVLLKCDGTSCTSPIQVDSAMTNDAIDKGVKTLISRWK